MIFYVFIILDEIELCNIGEDTTFSPWKFCVLAMIMIKYFAQDRRSVKYFAVPS